jgi:hypothetical protein
MGLSQSAWQVCTSTTPDQARNLILSTLIPFYPLLNVVDCDRLSF